MEIKIPDQGFDSNVDKGQAVNIQAYSRWGVKQKKGSYDDHRSQGVGLNEKKIGVANKNFTKSV